MGGRASRQSGGSIRRLKSGRWQVRLRDRATGRYVTLGTFPTKADADAAMTVAKADVQRGGFVAPERGRVPLEEVASEWLTNHPTLAPKTRELYRMLLDKHILPHLGEVALGHIEPATVERWFGKLGGSGSPVTAASTATCRPTSWRTPDAQYASATRPPAPTCYASLRTIASSTG